MATKEKPYPYLKNSTIEKESMKLLNSFSKQSGQTLSAPVPVFDIIEYLGYDINFRKDGIYKDKNILGGLQIADKTVEINENISGHEGRMNFTAAHEIGHMFSLGHKEMTNVDLMMWGDGERINSWQADKLRKYHNKYLNKTLALN